MMPKVQEMSAYPSYSRRFEAKNWLLYCVRTDDMATDVVSSLHYTEKPINNACLSKTTKFTGRTRAQNFLSQRNPLKCPSYSSRVWYDKLEFPNIILKFLWYINTFICLVHVLQTEKCNTLWNNANLLREPWGIPYAKYAWTRQGK